MGVSWLGGTCDQGWISDLEVDTKYENYWLPSFPVWIEHARTKYRVGEAVEVASSLEVLKVATENSLLLCMNKKNGLPEVCTHELAYFNMFGLYCEYPLMAKTGQKFGKVIY